MAEELTRKRRVRGGHKASATRIMTRVEEMLSSGDEPQRAVLNQLSMSLKEKLEEIKLLDAEILTLVGDDELEDEIGRADNYKERVYASLIEIEAPVTSRVPARTTPAMGYASSKVRLPKLLIKPFNGILTQWTPFWDSYKCAIHENPELSKVDKFNYLRSMVSNTALEAISGLTLTDANYDEAIDLLQKRFGNKQLIINKHMEQLLHVDGVASQNDTKGIRQLYDVIESNVRSLKSLGVSAESYGSLLSSVLMSKLPSELRLIASRKFGDSESWDFTELLGVIEEEVQARERSTTRANSEPTRGTETRRPKEHPTGAALFTETTTLKCCFCEREHASQDCRTVASIESRREVIRRTGRCYICLGKGHVSRNCRSRIKCRSCKGRHHVAICSGQPRRKAPENKQQESPGTGGLDPEAPPFQLPKTGLLWTYSSKPVLLQTARATAYNPDCPSTSLSVRMVMDTGSQRSYITNSARSRLELTAAGEQRMTIMTFGSAQNGDSVCEYVKLGLKLKNGETQNLSLFTVPTICEPLKPHPLVDYRRTYPHLSGLEFADDPEDAETIHVDMLVGSDHYWDLVTGALQRGTNGPVAIETRLGWVLSGPISTPSMDSHGLITHSLHITCEGFEEKMLNDTMRSFWELESFGIPNTDRSLYDKLRDTIEFREGRYEVQLPWKAPRLDLPNNYALSLKRLKGLLRRLRHDPDVLREYDMVIKTQFEQGIVELVEDLANRPDVHYLPHHPVIRKDKTTTKVRVVYDASAKTSGPSLNDCLDQGPKFDQKILDILCRFRTHRVAVTADIEKAFLMISVAAKDRDFLRFLWVDDAVKDEPRIVVYRFARVVFGVNASPFLLNATIRHHLEIHADTHREIVSKVIRSIYVDDIVTGSQSEEQAYQLYSEAKTLLKTGAFNLRKFYTNATRLQAKVDLEESAQHQDEPKPMETYSQSTLSGNGELCDAEQRILGLKWNITSDQIIFSLADLAEQARRLEPTKRNVISLIGRVYDPLGFLAPIVVRYKVFMQSLCKAKIGWDEKIPEASITQWSKLVLALEDAQPLTIPRCYLEAVQGEVLSYQLCGYCDASLSAYAAVIYLLIETKDKTHMRFVVAKTRVAPLKKQTVPRLELLSAVLLARLMNTTKLSLNPEIEISSFHCFIDSQVALCWIRNIGKSWKPFVQNRVSEIRNLFPVECWNHIPGVENPADVPSRGTTPLELLVNKLWRDGPSMPFRYSDKATDDDLPSECLEELPASEKRAVHGLLTIEESSVTNLIQVNNFSDINKLVNVLTYVLKFCSYMKRLISPTTVCKNERMIAEVLLIKEAQLLLRDHKNFLMWEKQLFLFEDEHGVLRSRGRIANATLPYSTKHPIILPSDHPLTTMYIRQSHSRVLHNGVKETLTELRSRFWVIKGRSVVKQVLHSCNTCRRHEGMSCRVPPPPPLPTFRVQEAPPFTSTGVDFAGPLYVKHPGGVQTKVWIVLYTCCVTRAIHLDLVSDMSAPTFIRSFKRFSARRGLPAMMISDNGKTFVAAAKTIKRVVSSPEVQNYLEGTGCEWRFNVPRAPWWGGLFERLVRSTKRCLRKALGQAKFSYDELLTALVEIEMVLNSRPLTYISADDLDEPLTPSHLLVGRRLMSFPDHLFCDEDTDCEVDSYQLNARLKHLNYSLDAFWKRWRKEYLVELREAHRHYRSNGEPQITEGDVVVVYSDAQPRSFWKLGRIERLLVGADGQIRAASVRISNKGRTSVMNRPIQHLYPLEAAPPADPVLDDPALEPTDDSKNPDQSTNVSLRPKRSAAALARDRILAQAASDMEFDTDNGI